MALSTGAQPRSVETATRRLAEVGAGEPGRDACAVAGRERIALVLADLGAQQQVGICHGAPHRPGDAEGEEPVARDRRSVRRRATAGSRPRRRTRQACAGCRRGRARRQRTWPSASAAAEPPDEPPQVLSGIERIAGGAVDPVARVAAGAEFRRVGLAQDDAAGPADIGDAELVLGRHVVLVQQRAQGRSQARRRLQVLDADGEAHQQADLVPLPIACSTALAHFLAASASMATMALTAPLVASMRRKQLSSSSTGESCLRPICRWASTAERSQASAIAAPVVRAVVSTADTRMLREREGQGQGAESGHAVWEAVRLCRTSS